MRFSNSLLAAVLMITGALGLDAAQLGTFTTFPGGAAGGPVPAFAGVGTYISGTPILEQTFDWTALPASFVYTLDSSQPNFNAVATLLTNGIGNSISFFWSINSAPSPGCCGGTGSEQGIFFPISGITDFQGYQITSVVITLDQFSATRQLFGSTLLNFWTFRENITVNGELAPPVPEPGTWLLLAPALAILLQRRRQQR